MPLVRIEYRKGIHNDLGNKIGAIVYRSMVETINVPENDNFQIITEHEVNGLIYDPDYLGIHRSDGIIIIQVTLNEGRTTRNEEGIL